MAVAKSLATRPAGVPLKELGGLPRPVGPVDFETRAVQRAAARRALETAAPKTQDDQYNALIKVGDISPSLATVLRPQAAYRWLLPYLASITPTYVESVLRGALAGNHVQAWELFDLMMDSDPEIGACVEEYVDGVLGHRVHFEPYHEEDEEPTPRALEKHKLVSSALRNMRPDPAADENALSGTLRDILFSRFHGQSVVEVDWMDGYRSTTPNFKTVPGQAQPALFPRSTYWVHPVCYAYSEEGRLGLRAAVGNLTRSDSNKYGPQWQMGPVGRALPQDAMVDRLMGDPPAWNFISSQPRVSNLVEFPRNKFIISTFKSKAGTALGGSTLRKIAWWWVASNYCGDFLLNLAQLFGVPFRAAKMAPNTSEPEKNEIRQMLQSCGHSGYILLPNGAELEFIEGGSTAGQSPQAFLFNFADSQKRKVILHQTMTGGSHDSMGKGGGKAFGEVEQDTKNDCIEAGARFCAEQVNLQLIPMVLELNYGRKDGDQEAPRCELVDNEVGGLADAQRDQVLSSMMNIPATYLRRKYGIPNPGPQDEVAGIDQGTNGAQMDQQQQQFNAQRKDMKDAAAAGRQHQLNLEREKTKQAQATGQPAAPKPGQEQQPGQQQRQPGSGDQTSVESRRALSAATAKTSNKGCLMAVIPEADAKRIVDWTKANLEAGTEAADGIEAEPHVTTFYGFNLGFHTDRIAELLSRRVPVTLTLGKVGRFEAADYDVLIIDIDSPDLENLSSTIAGRFEDDVTPSEHEYNPHLTLAYVKKGSNKGLDGSADFAGEQFRISSMVYSEPGDANRRTFELKARAAVQARRVPAHFQSKADVAQALHETVEPLLKRLDAISKIDDEQTRDDMMRKLLKDLPQVTAAMLHDDSVAKAFAPEAVRRFVESLKKGQE